jgi:hypothetical protein
MRPVSQYTFLTTTAAADRVAIERKAVERKIGSSEADFLAAAEPRRL